jgi:hypothetical protein
MPWDSNNIHNGDRERNVHTYKSLDTANNAGGGGGLMFCGRVLVQLVEFF